MTVKEAVKKMIEEFEALAGIELFIANDLDEAIDNVITAAREEGAELERARIRDSNPFVFTGEYYVLPAAVLAPKEEK